MHDPWDMAAREILARIEDAFDLRLGKASWSGMEKAHFRGYK